MQERPGCLAGILKLLALGWVFDWLNDHVGFGRGGCSGIGCGIILLFIVSIFACSILFGTNWFQASF